MLAEFHTFETGATAPDGGKCRWHVRYVLEKEEIRRALTLSERRRTSPARIAVESAVGAVAGTVCLVNFFTDGDRPFSVLAIGLLCFVLAAAAVLYSPLSVRKLAAAEAEKQKKINLWVGENGLGFGKKAEHYREVAYGDVAAVTDGDLLLLFPTKNNLVALPRVAVDAACWEFLCDRLAPRTFGKQEKNR